MNWFPVPRYRAITLWLVTLACGHSGLADQIITSSGWFQCPHCEAAAKQTKLMGLPVTWRPA